MSGRVLPPSHSMYVVSNDSEQVMSYKPTVMFDRGHVTSCSCTCGLSAAWCSHIVALCLCRIHQPQTVSLRPPVSESLSRLQKIQLQKFSQYLISELPRQVLLYLLLYIELCYTCIYLKIRQYNNCLTSNFISALYEIKPYMNLSNFCQLQY